MVDGVMRVYADGEGTMMIIWGFYACLEKFTSVFNKVSKVIQKKN